MGAEGVVPRNPLGCEAEGRRFIGWIVKKRIEREREFSVECCLAAALLEIMAQARVVDNAVDDTTFPCS